MLETESWAIYNLRSVMATASIGIALLISIPLSEESLGWRTPWLVLCLIGGLLGIAFYVVPNRRIARRLGFTAFGATVVGLVGLVIVGTVI
jgi:drug/metabolite transporter (DMT)-like permease